jgi:acyl-CoA synthetase (AMP-forming)/AMP-acid ligase II
VWGEQVTAAVVLTRGSTLTCDELVAYLRPRLAGYKLPRRLTVLEQLPRNAGGKVLKRDLRKALGP